MVPLQVYNSLRNPEERRLLMQISHLIIGGGAIDGAMEAELKHFPNAVWSTYGMTETLSHIALRRISGSEASPWYVPFEGVDIRTDVDGCLVIKAPAVCRDVLVTNDMAEIAPDGIVRSHIEERAIVVAKYILEKNTTVRQTAKTFGVSKSTIHKDVTERLEEINPTLAKEVKMVLEKNKSERHIRGGMATKLKYEKETQKDVG